MLSVCTFLKVVGYYDFRILSMSVMSFQKKKFGWGWVGGVNSIQVYFGFFAFFNFAKPLSEDGYGWLRKNWHNNIPMGPGKKTVEAGQAPIARDQ